MSWLEDMVRNRQEANQFLADLILEGRRQTERAAELEFAELLRPALDSQARRDLGDAMLGVAQEEGF
jgi:hypothetical protein